MAETARRLLLTLMLTAFSELASTAGDPCASGTAVTCGKTPALCTEVRTLSICTAALSSLGAVSLPVSRAPPAFPRPHIFVARSCTSKPANILLGAGLRLECFPLHAARRIPHAQQRFAGRPGRSRLATGPRQHQRVFLWRLDHLAEQI